MKYNFKIHYTTSAGDDDWFVVSADTITEVRELADNGVEQRNGTNPWSEEVYGN